jgi:glycosyltransferase involved in cell wall biosynthesis
MKISLITVTYNSESTIRTTIESVLQQDYYNIEHIIIDGLSEDQTLNILSDYLSIKKVVSEPDSGIYEAMNKGIKIATGDIIGILNSDDFYVDNKVITTIANYFKENTLIQAIYANLVYVDRDNIDIIKRIWEAGEFDRKHFLNGWTLPHPTFFVRKEVYERYGAYNTTLKIAADYELILRFLYKFNINVAYLPITIVKMRVGGASNGSFKKRVLVHQEDKLY